MTKLIPAERKRLLAIARSYGTPVYVYDEKVLVRQAARLQRLFPDIAFHYAIKANANPTILRTLKKAGMGAEAVSPGELRLALSVGFKPAQISFTCSSMTEGELVEAARSGVRVHLDSLGQLRLWGERKLGSHVSIRLNQGIGAGHHAHVITGGPDSKFGIGLRDIPEVLKIAKKYRLTITGVQQHIGSNVLDAAIVEKAIEKLLNTVSKFPDITHIDFGGGLGVPYEPGVRPLALETLGKRVSARIRRFTRETGRSLTFAMEPGRFLVAEAGTLLVLVTDSKETEKHLFVGVNSGFNHLVRPAMYGSYHPIENLTRARGPRKPLTIVGNVCESGDIFATKRRMVMPVVGDILAIQMAGAYGFSMASEYNLRKRPKEILIQSATRFKNISFDPRDYVV